MKTFLVLIGVLISLIGGSLSNTDNPNGYTILAKLIRQYINSQPEDVKLSDGVHIISTRSENDARANGDDGTLFGAMENYLENHEIRIKLPELMPSEGFGRALKTAVDEVEGKDEKSTGRGKKGGGGGGGIALVGLMMGKMMAALGIGGVGLLAMKALMVSALALMLSLIIGLKKLVHHDDDGGGHHVIHASSHGHDHYRRKREAAADMAYSSWEQYKMR